MPRWLKKLPKVPSRVITGSVLLAALHVGKMIECPLGCPFMQLFMKMCPLEQENSIMCLNEGPSKNLMQCPVKCPNNDRNLTIHVGALPMEMGVVMRPPLHERVLKGALSSNEMKCSAV